jgi:ATP-dependent Clp protease ATP-binding subunit ClpB
MNELRESFHPEFLNRVDDIVLFKPLHLDEIVKITGLLAAEFIDCLEERHITLTLSDEAKRFIARSDFDPVYGARPQKRFLRRELETRVAHAIIAGDVHDGGALQAGLKDGQLEILISH